MKGRSFFLSQLSIFSKCSPLLLIGQIYEKYFIEPAFTQQFWRQMRDIIGSGYNE
jgi:hypothetical protein